MVGVANLWNSISLGRINWCPEICCTWLFSCVNSYAVTGNFVNDFEISDYFVEIDGKIDYSQIGLTAIQKWSGGPCFYQTAEDVKTRTCFWNKRDVGMAFEISKKVNTNGRLINPPLRGSSPLLCTGGVINLFLKSSDPSGACGGLFEKVNFPFNVFVKCPIK